ncbi:membrane hypothetical protein [Paraburkholderia piptadeniae]|uniref:Transmembrane protein n=1 Tax=Paraburkholderia piptadeniae TaxID=1701573 RepID=A0A1N7RQY6_9BURK|nr:hypothetical protein [Paraburkholderia piptadeniae]SIT37112.1 membrane hypothetical protein [Paraburkholderia piptadeniae]
MDLQWELKITLAAVPVLLIASRVFGEPSWSRSYTTAARYRGAWLAYIVLHVIMLVAVCAALRRGWGEQGTVWIGLGIIMPLSACSGIMRHPRAWLHRQADIPSKAHDLAKELAEGRFTIDMATRENAKRLLVKRGVDVDDEWAGLDVPAQRLLDATALFLALCRWQSDRHYRFFMREADNEFYALRCHFDQLSLRIPRTFDSIRCIGEMLHLFRGDRDADANAPIVEFQGISRRVVNDLIMDACKDITAFYDEACLFAARGALVRHVSGRRRAALLHAMGFEYEDDLRPTPLGVLAKAGLLLYAGIWSVTLILPNQIPQHDHHIQDISNAARVAMITIIVLTALGITIFTKQRWGFANAGLDGRTPLRFLIGAGVCASLFATVVNLATGALLLGGWHGALVRLSFGWPFLHFSGVTAIAVGWLVQDHRWRRTPRAGMRRLFDALLLSLVWIVASSLSVLMMNVAAFDHGSVADRLLMALNNAPPILGPGVRYGMPFVSLVFGAVIGATVAESVRRVYPRERAPHVRTGFGTASSGVGA